MVKKIFFNVYFISFIVGTFFLTSCANSVKKIEIINVSYDATREFYDEYNTEFTQYWQNKTDETVDIIQSHGGSGKQARSVIEGNLADVVTLGLSADVDALVKQGLVMPNWQQRLPDKSAPYTSTIVFVVRKENPKNILNWQDLTKPDVSIITPNPKTSGGARWNYLAMWAWAYANWQGDETQIKTFMGNVFKNVAVWDSGARGATTTFVESEQGDVLLAWENEAFLIVEKNPEKYELVTPSISILAQPSVAVVDEVVDKKNTRQLATEYLSYLYSESAQRMAAKNFYRPTNKQIQAEYDEIFNFNLQLVSIDDDIFGGWEKVQAKHFADNGLFDEIYKTITAP